MSSLLCLALSNAALATLLAVFVVVLARFCRRPALRHALWLLVLLKLITPPLLPISMMWLGSEESEPPPAESPPAPVASEETTHTGSQALITARSVNEENSLADAAGCERTLRAAEVLIVVWLGGALAWWSVAAVRLRKFRRLLRQARPAAADVQEQGHRMAALLGLRRCPPILFVAAPLSPMLWALGISPRLLMPVELWRKLAVEQQDTLLVHELTHLRRGDHWIRRLELLVLGLYWWHPVVWWARRRLQEAEEECCDALVIAVLPDAAPAYASALVETVAFLSQTRPAALVGASGAGQVPLLKRRLTMILTETPSRKSSRIGFWIVLGLGALLLPLAPRAARTQAPEEPKRIESKSRIDDSVKARHENITLDVQAKNCIACHEQQTVNPHELQHPWKEIHDELLRVMEEYTREARKTDRRSPSAEDRERAEKIENLQDDIELLKVQVRLKEARIGAAKKTLEEYRRRLVNYREISKRQPGAIQTDTIMEVQLHVTNHEGQLLVNEAELQESLVRLKQAERRLARLQRPGEKIDGRGRTQQEKRLRELEQKVEDLLKEIHKMRKEMQPEKPRNPRQQPDG